MVGQAERLGIATLTRLAEVMHTGLVDMRGTTSPRLVLELLCARMLLPGASTGDAALLQRLERMERRMEIAGGPVAAPEPPRIPESRRPEPTPPPEQRSGPAERPARPAAAGPNLGLPVRPRLSSDSRPAVDRPEKPARPAESSGAAGAVSGGVAAQATDVTENRHPRRRRPRHPVPRLQIEALEIKTLGIKTLGIERLRRRTLGARPPLPPRSMSPTSAGSGPRCSPR